MLSPKLDSPRRAGASCAWMLAALATGMLAGCGGGAPDAAHDPGAGSSSAEAARGEDGAADAGPTAASADRPARPAVSAIPWTNRPRLATSNASDSGAQRPAPAADEPAASAADPNRPIVTAPGRRDPAGGASQSVDSPAARAIAEEPATDDAPAPRPAEIAQAVPAPGDAGAHSPPAAAGSGSLDEQLRALQVPPPWLASVTTRYDTTKPWKDARLEIRRLLGLNQDAPRREAIKLTWIYLQKNDIGDGHEYPMYMYLGAEPIWAVRAYEEFIARPHPNSPMHAMLPLASLYALYGEYDRAEATLEKALRNSPPSPWRIAGQADVNAALGDLYAAWGKSQLARKHYAEAIRLYPTSNQPYGQPELKRKAAKVQTRLDLLDARALETAKLKDGRYQTSSLGYSGDIGVTLVIARGRIADVQIKHQEKIDQNACVIVPRQIVERQSLKVDSISGATITKDAIVDGVFQGMKQAAR